MNDFEATKWSPIEVPAVGDLQNLQVRALTSYRQYGKYAAQLIDKSRQPHIMEYEWEDSAPGGRFEDNNGLINWMNLGKFVFMLTDGEELAGMSWFSRQEYAPGYDLTYGIRLYEGYVGRGLCIPYMQSSHRLMATVMAGHGLWLSAKVENQRAIYKYQEFGYRQDYVAGGLQYMLNDDALVV